MSTLIKNIENLTKQIDGITDIYVKGDDKLTIRAKGKLGFKFNNDNEQESTITFSEEDLKSFLISNLKRYELSYSDFLDLRRFDFSCEIGEAKYRVNASLSKKKLLLIFRVIKTNVININDLGIELEYLNGIINASQGLFLVSGPTGSGKSTTLSSIVDYFNENTNNHIVTLENPIEQIYKDKNSVIHQQELGDDFKNFEEAMENVLRQDPNIIVIGEIRSKEVLDIALRLSETGHLVIATIHGKGANGIVGKIIRMYDNEKLISGMLADCLVGILYQQKFELNNGETVICMETLYNTEEVQAGFKQGKSSEFKSNMETGKKEGMITMTQYLNNHLNEKYNLSGAEYKEINSSINGL